MDLHLLKPAIPRHFLFFIAGIIWTGVGLVLCLRAIGWLIELPVSSALVLGLAGIAITIPSYRFGFSQIVRRNSERIIRLPERPCLFAFTAWRGYFIIGAMITVGIVLRNSSIPKPYLTIPYMTMGGSLLAGSFNFYRTFRNVSLHVRQTPSHPNPIDQSR